MFFFGEVLGDEQLDDGLAILRFLGLHLKLGESANSIDFSPIGLLQTRISEIERRIITGLIYSSDHGKVNNPVSRPAGREFSPME